MQKYPNIQNYDVKVPDEVLSELTVTRVSLIIWNQSKLDNDLVTFTSQ